PLTRPAARLAQVRPAPTPAFRRTRRATTPHRSARSRRTSEPTPLPPADVEKRVPPVRPRTSPAAHASRRERRPRRRAERGGALARSRRDQYPGRRRWCATATTRTRSVSKRYTTVNG